MGRSDMTAPQGLTLAHRHGITVIVDGDHLRARPAPSDEIRAALAADKRAIVDYLATAFAPPDASTPPALIVEHWRQRCARLDPEVAPVPGFAGGEWTRVHNSIVTFLDPRASPSWPRIAVEGEWSTLELFGVDRRVGAARIDRAGALLCTNGAIVTRVTPQIIWLANGLAYRRTAMEVATCCAIWNFTGRL
jgi:hypothetical protein